MLKSYIEGQIVTRVMIAIIFGFLTLYTYNKVFRGNGQFVKIQVLDINNQIIHADCTVTDSRGATYFSDYEKGTFVISKEAGMLTPDCIAEGYIQKSFDIDNDYKILVTSNIFSWISFLADALSGFTKYSIWIKVFMEKLE